MRPVALSIPKNRVMLIPARYGKTSNVRGYEDPHALKLVRIIAAAAATQRNYWDVRFQVSGSPVVMDEFQKATISWQLYASTCKVAEMQSPGQLSSVEKVQLWQGTKVKFTKWLYDNPIVRERLYKHWRSTAVGNGFYEAVHDLAGIIWKCTSNYLQHGTVR